METNPENAVVCDDNNPIEATKISQNEGAVAAQSIVPLAEKEAFEASTDSIDPAVSTTELIVEDTSAVEGTPLQDTAAADEQEDWKLNAGCYLVYDSGSGGRLMLKYSRGGGDIPFNAVGFWCPGEGRTIKGFKFTGQQGRSELIGGIMGGDANRRKYFVGWIQYLKLAQQMRGRVIKLKAQQSVEVDVYGYNTKTREVIKISSLDDEGSLTEMSCFDCFAVVPKHADFLGGIKVMAKSHFLDAGNQAGAAGEAPPDTTDNHQPSGNKGSPRKSVKVTTPNVSQVPRLLYEEDEKKDSLGDSEILTSTEITTTNTADSTIVQEHAEEALEEGEEVWKLYAGCYLVYDSGSGGRLMLKYSRGGGDIPFNAVGFWCPGEGKTIKGFKFTSQQGRSELIGGIMGGDANRRKYFVGWIQYLKLAKHMKGRVIKLKAQQSVEVDVYGYNTKTSEAMKLEIDEGLTSICAFDCFAVVPRNADLLGGIKEMAKAHFLNCGNRVGASSEC